MLKIVEQETLHFTLKFLGEITEEQSRKAGNALRTIECPRIGIELTSVKDMLENIQIGEMLATSFSLKQSTLIPQEPVYKELVRIELV
ncbi:MAG: hypothetical protein HZB65_02005 [Candidatus Aenigmarchaeota archaeon]|nr:hypothetical protein [Candidatus Aenigmarchaeota archaeon]